jgi:hypothetical protein
MASIDLTAFSHALKIKYVSDFMEDTLARDHPFLALLLARKKRVSGKYIDHVIDYSRGGGRSASFSLAQGNPLGTKGVQMALQTVQDYAVVRWDDELLQSVEGQDAAAFFDARTKEADNKMAQLGDSASHALFRGGSGAIMQIASTQSGSSTTINAKVADDVKHLQVGMKIYADSVDGGGTVGTTISFVKSVDLEAGTYEVAATDGGAADTATNRDLTANQYVFVYGDYDAKVDGIQSWLPSSVSGGDSFWGVNRSVDRIRLAGWYKSFVGTPIEEAIPHMASLITRIAEANPKLCIINPNDWVRLVNSLGTRVNYIDIKPDQKATFGFRGILLNGPKGPIEVVQDADCPDKEALLLDMRTWLLYHKGDSPMSLINRDGLTIRAVADADQWEARFKSNLQLACDAPGFNGRMILRS